MSSRFQFFRLFLVLFVVSASGDSLDILYADEILHIPVGADISAMGDAGVVYPRRAIAAHWNPAASGMLDRYEASVEYAGLYWGLSHHGALAFHAPLQGATGITALVIPFYSGAIATFDSLPGTFHERLLDPSKRADGSGTGVITDNQNLFLLSLGKKLSFPMPRSDAAGQPRDIVLALGLGFRGITHIIRENQKVRMGMNANIDAGMLLQIDLDYDFVSKQTVRQLLMGAAFKNFIPGKVNWAHSDDGSGLREYSEPLKPVQYLGISYNDISKILGADWLVSLELHKDYDVSYHGGIEAVFWDLAAFRAGFSGSTPTLGAGVRYRNYFFDYAFRFDPVAVTALRVSAGIMWN